MSGFSLYAILIHWGTIGCMGKILSMLENYIKWKISCRGTFNGSAGGVWQVTSCRAFVAFRPPTCTSVLDPRQAALCRCEPGILSQGRLFLVSGQPAHLIFTQAQEVIDTRLLATGLFSVHAKLFLKNVFLRNC